MRRVVKYRLGFVLVAVLCYWLGFSFLPKQLTNQFEQLQLALFAGLYFILLPLLYWRWIIRLGKQKPWKLLLIFSLSSLMARLGFPAEIAGYFEFIAWLRFPIIAVLLALECYLMYSIIRGLWQARRASGDPRLTIVSQYGEQAIELATPESAIEAGAVNTQCMLDKQEKKLTLGLMLATEPASWYYAIPYFSRKHPEAIVHLKLSSARRWHFLALVTGLVVSTLGSYLLLVGLSEIVAVLVAGFIGYGLVMLAANHRIARHYSVYLQGDRLIINNGIWGFMAVKLADIKSIEPGHFPEADKECDLVKEETEELRFGRGSYANLRLSFCKPQTYYGGMGHLAEQFTRVDLVLDEPQKFNDRVCIQELELKAS
jgi:hypothetical protein